MEGERVQVCGDNKNLIPLTFVLGFYVQFVVGRWWDQYLHYPWPDRILNLIIIYINGADEKSRIVRRTLARWLCLSTILLTRGVSVVAMKRFPHLDDLIEAGLMNKEEKELYENVNIPYAKYWVPMLWFNELLKKTKEEKLLDDPFGVVMKHISEEVATFRTNQWKIWSFDWVSVPLVYTQVITLAIYTYFMGCTFSRQFLDPAQKYEHFYVDFYFPAFAFLQFFFYVGWLKVAESLINPWGEDDDDFEVNWFIDRHILVAFLQVDEKFGQIPRLVKDSYWKKTNVRMPYTSKADMTRSTAVDCMGSTAHLSLPMQSSQRDFSQLDEMLLPLPEELMANLRTTSHLAARRQSFPRIGKRLHSSESEEYDPLSAVPQVLKDESSRRKVTPMRMLSTVTIQPVIEERPESTDSRSETTSPTSELAHFNLSLHETCSSSEGEQHSDNVFLNSSPVADTLSVHLSDKVSLGFLSRKRNSHSCTEP